MIWVGILFGLLSLLLQWFLSKKVSNRIGNHAVWLCKKVVTVGEAAGYQAVEDADLSKRADKFAKDHGGDE
jgi:hypothetical protein